MRKNIQILFSLLILASMVLSACGPTATPTQVVVEEPEPVEEVVEEPAEEVVAEEPEVVEEVVEEVAGPADEAVVDAAFTDVLTTMEGYLALGDMAAFNEMLLSDTPPFVLDVRQPSELEEKGHIEGAVNIPLRELAQNLDLLPSFDTPMVVYCGSGWRSTIATTALRALGWANAISLTGDSFGGWVEAGYPVVAGAAPEAMVLDVAAPDAGMVYTIDEMLSSIPEGWGSKTADVLFTDIVEKPELILIDVRRPEEVEETGMIEAPNVVHVQLEEMINMKDQWPADKDAEIVVYCKGGHRGVIAMTTLWSYGYTNLTNLKGGFGGWIAGGFGGEEVAEAEADYDLDVAFADFLAQMEGYQAMGDHAALNEMLISDTPPFLLDVREVSELEEKGHIEGAVNIPLREVGANFDKLPAFDTPIVVYCGSGWRAAIAAVALETMGWQDVKALTGGSFGGWVEAGYPVVEGVAQDAEVLNAVELGDGAVAAFSTMFANLPEGWGVKTVDALSTELLENPDIVLVDVRKPEELAETGVIDAANVVHIQLEEFIAMKDQWPAQDAQIVVYCKSGHRGLLASTILWSYGYENVSNLKGAITAWMEAGYPVAEYATP